jgi:sulfoxide reductase catalytic subunit YedY
MFIHQPDPFAPRGGTETPERVFFNRRRWLQIVGLGGGSAILGGYFAWRLLGGGEDAKVLAAGHWPPESERKFAAYYPAVRDDRFTYGRAETQPAAAARYTNFYEFSRFKWCWKYVGDFQPDPWTISVSGLCRNPLQLDLEAFHRQFQSDLVERQYRHRCVERWAMAVPWTGIPLATLLKVADPLAEATHVRFISFSRPSEAPHQAVSGEFPWPYAEGLTLAEATNDLALLAVGVYGRPLLKQHGAPIRLVVPWKYGYKSIKSVERIELVSREPATLWSTLNPAAYPFESNVDPAVPRPWNQSEERMLGTDARLPTQKYNGYGEWVAPLYSPA